MMGAERSRGKKRRKEGKRSSGGASSCRVLYPIIRTMALILSLIES